MNYTIYIIIALVLTAFILIVITPSNKDGKLNKVFQALHDFFNFKKMYLTLVIKAIVIFTTVFSVVFGFRLLFGISYYGYHYSTFWYGLGFLVLGPIVIRLSYELLWLSISAAQAVIQIRDKMYGKEKSHFDSDFDKELNAAEKFGSKVYEDTKKFSGEALDAANKKLNEYKESKQNNEKDSTEENTDESK